MNMLEAQGGLYSVKILRVIRENYPYIGNLKNILNEWFQKTILISLINIYEIHSK